MIKRKRPCNFAHESPRSVAIGRATAGARRSQQPLELAPFRRSAINRRLAEAVGKAIASAKLAYGFAPGSYTGEALSDVLAIKKLLGWIEDLDGARQ
jgi:hypothetical protein